MQQQRDKDNGGAISKDVPNGGKVAAKFAQEKLAGREFTVVTRFQNALGRSSLARFYSVVLEDGKNLAEELGGERAGTDLWIAGQLAGRGTVGDVHQQAEES